MKLFDGDRTAYGIYRIPKDHVKEGKKTVGKAATVRRPISTELWDNHLNGVDGLGIIPINQDSMVKFGAIDIDDYDVTTQRVNELVTALKLPLVVCRTKSGGAHCYCFTREFTSAKLMQNKLRDFASALGFGTSEIFPKQTEILAARGDIGQWINMPYFDSTQTTRYALHPTKNKALDIDEFVKLAYDSAVEPDALRDWHVPISNDLEGAPPCLQTLCDQGFPSGTRNGGMYNLGVYALKAHPDCWEDKLEEYNNEYMDPPLASTEVQGIIKSLQKRDYEYSCKVEPIHSFCNISKCRSCKFGVNTGTGLPAMGTLTKLDTEPPLWFIDIVGGGRLELQTEELQNPLKFQKKCMETLNTMPVVMKREGWQLVVQQLLTSVSIISVPKDTSSNGPFYDYLEEFCCGRVQAKTYDDILVGKPYTLDNKHIFRLRDLEEFMVRKKITDIKRNKMTSMLRDMKAEHAFKVIKGRGTNLWCIPAFRRPSNELTIPELQGERADGAF
jgi:hypothetical protein